MAHLRQRQHITAHQPEITAGRLGHDPGRFEDVTRARRGRRLPAVLSREEVTRLLAAANSVGSGLTSPIFSVKQAFLVLGINRIVSIVLAAALSYRYDARGSGFDSRLLWRRVHAIRAAAAGRT